MGWNLSRSLLSPASVMAARVASWPSGGIRQTAAISLTASRATWVLSGMMDLDRGEIEQSLRTLII